MPVTLTNKDIGTRYALQEDFNNGFVGRDRQVVIQTDDPKGYRPVIMDGKTTGGKSKVALVADLTDYATKTELNTKANVTHSHSISDVINLQTTIDSKANTTHSHSIDDVTDLRSSIEGRVKKTGDRGQLAGFETTQDESSNTITITENSPDCITMTSTGNKTITVSSTAQNNSFCIKYVCCYVAGSSVVTVNGISGTFGGEPLEFGEGGWAIALVKNGAGGWEGISIGKW